ncbi:MAG: hypothetical protein E7434_00075 [Ruminococcaceae bacterium]|nr:hypothetical protein [Oscillospiraceae bacterium]
MESVREYFLQIVAVCMIAAISCAIVKNPLIARVIRLISGILILLVVIAPLSKVDASKLPTYLDGVLDSDTQMQEAKNHAHLQFQTQVQKATQEHIELIADQFGFNIQAEVTVSDDEVPIPIEVKLIGTPNAQQMLQLSDYIETNVGIPKDQQIWRRVND